MTTTTFPQTIDLKPGTTASPELTRYVLLDARERRRMARRRHLLIALEVNGRATLSRLAAEVNAPITTVFEDLQAIKREYRIIPIRNGHKPTASSNGLPPGWQSIQQRRRERRERVIAALKQDGRASLAQLSRQLNIPRSTLSEDMAAIKKHVRFSIERNGTGGVGLSPAEEARGRQRTSPEVNR